MAGVPGFDVVRYVRPHRLLRAIQSGRSGSGAAIRPLLDAFPPRCHVFHGLNQRLPRRGRARYVVTFHDLFVMTARYSTPEFRARFTAQAREAAARADLYICVSRFTAGQLETLLGADPRRIRVIPHGTLCPDTVPPAGAREPAVLFVGALQERKNISRLIDAFEALPAEWRLVLAGSAGFGAGAIDARIDESPRRRDISVLGYVSEGRLEELYRSCSILAFPSLDEGFGIPILEAMARGLPVLTSNRSACPEVAGDAALLADPLDTASLADGLLRLAGDVSLREELARKGRARAAEFSWQRAAAATADVYRELSG
jgi:glycosyltransferase involved in cell wall biosynthesis